MVHPATRRPIRELPSHVANQIAAGEVIERPASVVKELLENAIDAAAANIEIDVEQGGAALIRVRDDGHGIGSDDLALALAPHATSKLQNAEELTQIKSLGFRGEALASISSVSRLTLYSRTVESEEGWQLTGVNEALQPVPHPVGTTIEMRDLFFNTPARRKFLRTQRTEFLHIEDVVKRLALSHFDIGFTLRHNGRQIFRLRPAAEHRQLQQRIKQLLGKAFGQHAIELASEAGSLRLSGWLLKPEMSRSQADIQYLYLNGRMIRDRLVTHGVRQAYGDRLPAGRYPAYLLYLEMDPGQVDVNVHPTKHEVRFREARSVHDFLFTALDRALREASGVAQDREASVGQAADGYRTSLRSATTTAIAEQGSHYRKLYEVKGSDNHHTTVPGKAVAFLFGRFVLAENGNGPLLVDALKARRQIALHYLQQVDSETGTRGRPLLIPETLRVDSGMMTVAEQCAVSIKRIGFVIEPIGEESVVVRQVPAVLEKCDIQALVTTLLEQLKKGEERDDSLLRGLVDEIRMDDSRAMTLSEMDELLRQLEAVETAPHPPLSQRVWRQLDYDVLARLLDE